MSTFRPVFLLAAAVFVLAAFPSVASAAKPDASKPSTVPAAMRDGADKSDSKAAKAKPKVEGKQQSIGAPNAGRLAAASLLKGSRHLHMREGSHSWGVSALTHLLRRGADEVAKKHKSSVMLVGDLSAKGGGHLDGHGSHQSGRDADVAFYAVNSRGKAVTLKQFVAFDANGRGRDVAWANFDDARNWTLVETLLKDDKSTVRYLFITNPLKARLLAYAAKKGASKDLITRAATVMMSPPDADVHDNHFHVRIACPDSMRDVCVEEAAGGQVAPAAPAVAGASDGVESATAEK